MWKRVRWVLLALSVISVAVVIWLILLLDYAMVGPPYRIRAYKRIFDTLPTPSGWLPETEYRGMASGAVVAYRRYEVIQPYEKTQKLFETELAQQGWDLLEREHTDYDVSLLYYSEESYCLTISIGKQPTNETRYVYFTLSEVRSRGYCEMF